MSERKKGLHFSFLCQEWVGGCSFVCVFVSVHASVLYLYLYLSMNPILGQECPQGVAPLCLKGNIAVKKLKFAWDSCNSTHSVVLWQVMENLILPLSFFPWTLNQIFSLIALSKDQMTQIKCQLYKYVSLLRVRYISSQVCGSLW